MDIKFIKHIEQSYNKRSNWFIFDTKDSSEKYISVNLFGVSDAIPLI